jgi:hypothetical protein
MRLTSSAGLRSATGINQIHPHCNMARLGGARVDWDDEAVPIISIMF